MWVTPLVMEDFLKVILSIPLVDMSLPMDLCRVYNVPALHPKLKDQLTYTLKENTL